MKSRPSWQAGYQYHEMLSIQNFVEAYKTSLNRCKTMNNIDKTVEEEINDCAKPNNEAQNTSKPEGSLSEAQEQY